MEAAVGRVSRRTHRRGRLEALVSTGGGMAPWCRRRGGAASPWSGSCSRTHVHSTPHVPTA